MKIIENFVDLTLIFSTRLLVLHEKSDKVLPMKIENKKWLKKGYNTISQCLLMTLDITAWNLFPLKNTRSRIIPSCLKHTTTTNQQRFGPLRNRRLATFQLTPTWHFSNYWISCGCYYPERQNFRQFRKGLQVARTYTSDLAFLDLGDNPWWVPLSVPVI